MSIHPKNNFFAGLMKKLQILTEMIVALLLVFVVFLATSKISMTQDNAEGAKI